MQQQERFSRDCPLQGWQVQALIGTVSPGVGVLNTRYQDLSIWEGLREMGNKWNRPSHAYVD